MCGRTACTLAPDELCKACGTKSSSVSWRDHPGTQHGYTPSYNAAPSTHTPVMFSGKHLPKMANEEAETDFVMQPMMWGLIPHFYKGDSAKNHGYKTNNCRVESVEDKQMFSHLLKQGRRCVVLCDGFYEWQTTTKDKTKTPYLIYAPQPEHVRLWDRSSWEGRELNTTVEEGGTEAASNEWRGPVPLKMAGLFSRWTSTEGEEVWSYTVLTTESGKGFSWLHHRVPVILSSQELVEAWLDPTTPHSAVLKRTSSSPDLKWHAVSSEVNNSRNNTITCMQPAELNTKKPSTPGCKMMSAWLKVSKSSPRSQGGDQVKSERSQDADEATCMREKRKSSENDENIEKSKKLKSDSIDT